MCVCARIQSARFIIAKERSSAHFVRVCARARVRVCMCLHKYACLPAMMCLMLDSHDIACASTLLRLACTKDTVVTASRCSVCPIQRTRKRWCARMRDRGLNALYKLPL